MLFKVVLWGYGNEYRKWRKRLRELHDADIIHVLGITATEQPELMEIDGWPVISPTSISSTELDYVIICSKKYYYEIISFASRFLNVDNQKFLPLWLVDELLYEKGFADDYELLKKSRISILSNDCWGGIISHTLGVEHLSPTKNCWFYDHDYIKLLENLKHYLLETDPVFYEWRQGENKEPDRYPVLLLDDIRIFCNHDSDPEISINNWIRRRGKMNYDNIFVSFSPKTPEYEKSFSRLEGYNKRLCIVPWTPNSPISIRPLPVPTDKQWQAAVIRTALPNGCRTYFSPAKLLLTGEHY